VQLDSSSKPDKMADLALSEAKNDIDYSGHREADCVSEAISRSLPFSDPAIKR
jgi:hypothetical protein